MELQIELDVSGSIKKTSSYKNEQLLELKIANKEFEMRLDKIESTEKDDSSANRRLSVNIAEKQKTITSLKREIIDQSKIKLNIMIQTTNARFIIKNGNCDNCIVKNRVKSKMVVCVLMLADFSDCL